MKVYRRFIFDNGNVIDELLDEDFSTLDKHTMECESLGDFISKVKEVDEDSYSTKHTSRFYWSSNNTLINLDKVVLIETIKY